MANIKLEVSHNPMAWYFAEYAPGQRITKDMVSFDCTHRNDVQVNQYGVVLFYDKFTAQALLEGFVPPETPADLSEQGLLLKRAKEWTISELTRTAADYSDKLEFLSFRVTHGHETELLQDIPFPVGTTADDLAIWCAKDTAPSPNYQDEEGDSPLLYYGNLWLNQRCLEVANHTLVESIN